MESKQINASEATIGVWYTFCCKHDLAQIKDKDDLITILTDCLDFWEDEGKPFYRFWNTEEDALDALDID
jgi:hypothetical protein